VTSNSPETLAAPRPSRTRRVAIGLITAALIGLAFFGLMPALADYDEVWRAIQGISAGAVAALVGVGVGSLLLGPLPTMAVIPNLRFGRALYSRMVATTAANTIPGGGAVGVGLTYVMLGRWGHTAAEIGASVVLTGVWNNLARMLLPAGALLAAALTGVEMASLAEGTLIGVVGLVMTAAAIVIVLRSSLKSRVLRPIDRLIAWVRRIMRKPVHPAESPSERFLMVIGDAVGTRWVRLMLATLAYHLSLYACLEVSLRVVGVTTADVHWAEVLAAFALIRLISTIPLTPGSLGVTEVGLTGLLTVGLDAEQSALVAAGVLVFRFITYAVPTVAGAIAAIGWSRSKAK
jgi:putative heme transporter